MNEHRVDERSTGELVKITVNLPQSDWYDQGLEMIWAEPVDESRYRVRNVPFYANGLAFDDVIAAAALGGILVMQRVVESGGHSTYRIFLSDGLSTVDAKFLKYWEPLQQLGATFEAATKRLLSVDIPASTNIYQAYDLMQAGEHSGAWDFQEGHCGHDVST